MEEGRTWIKAAGKRAIRTAAQAALAMIPTATMIQAINWMDVVSISANAAIISMIMSIAGLPELKEDVEHE